MTTTTKTEGIIAIYKDGSLTAIVHKDEATRKNVFYSVSEMSFQDLEHFLPDALSASDESISRSAPSGAGPSSTDEAMAGGAGPAEEN